MGRIIIKDINVFIKNLKEKNQLFMSYYKFKVEIMKFFKIDFNDARLLARDIIDNNLVKSENSWIKLKQ